jgi:hypothetical protein
MRVSPYTVLIHSVARYVFRRWMHVWFAVVAVIVPVRVSVNVKRFAAAVLVDEVPWYVGNATSS